MGYHPITSVVKFMNKWYVGAGTDERPFVALSRVFDDKATALVYASKHPSDGGIHYFEPFHYTLCKELMQETPLFEPLKSLVPQEWSKCQERKTRLRQALAKHNLQRRKDSKVCLAYLSGDVEDLDEVVFQVGKWNFLYTKTNYRRVQSEACALANYRKHDPTLRDVPDYLHKLFKVESA